MRLSILVFLAVTLTACQAPNHVADLQRQIAKTREHVADAKRDIAAADSSLDAALASNGKADASTDTINSDLAACHSKRDAALAAVADEQGHWVGYKARHAARWIVGGLVGYALLAFALSWFGRASGIGLLSTLGASMFNVATLGVTWLYARLHPQPQPTTN